MVGLFQSTLPVKGATPVAPEIAFTRDISIHAPREGSDLSANVLHVVL